MTLWIGWAAVTVLLFVAFMGAHAALDAIAYRRAIRRRLRYYV